jgi:hypothetical protein
MTPRLWVSSRNSLVFHVDHHVSLSTFAMFFGNAPCQWQSELCQIPKQRPIEDLWQDHIIRQNEHTASHVTHTWIVVSWPQNWRRKSCPFPSSLACWLQWARLRNPNGTCVLEHYLPFYASSRYHSKCSVLLPESRRKHYCENERVVYNHLNYKRTLITDGLCPTWYQRQLSVLSRIEARILVSWSYPKEDKKSIFSALK